jgi:hypothetical protein
MHPLKSKRVIVDGTKGLMLRLSLAVTLPLLRWTECMFT